MFVEVNGTPCDDFRHAVEEKSNHWLVSKDRPAFTTKINTSKLTPLLTLSIKIGMR